MNNVSPVIVGLLEHLIADTKSVFQSSLICLQLKMLSSKPVTIYQRTPTAMPEGAITLNSDKCIKMITTKHLREFSLFTRLSTKTIVYCFILESLLADSVQSQGSVLILFGLARLFYSSLTYRYNRYSNRLIELVFRVP